mmetsp:Transcript_21524/g.27862  ORF Transcript_21524/g.27862 Transcript_21524/m.27862 type:complete len:360 (-) Transcript_21524:1037-2116(-)
MSSFVQNSQECDTKGGLLSTKSIAAVECCEGYANELQYGDLVMIYLNPNDIRHVYLEPGGIIENKYGKFEHSDIVGKVAGREIRQGKGWISVLAPSAELWSASLRHRTQIVQPQDCAIITFELGLKCGDIVIEAGTGSGAMTSAIARAVAPHGIVHSFEFNKSRVDTAIDEFEANSLHNIVRVEHRDVCQDGFPSNLKCDALFLDVPEPWHALPHAVKVLKPGGSFASYSPCLEQVQRVCAALSQLGAIDIRTVEARQRDFELRTRSFPSFCGVPSESEYSYMKEEEEEQSLENGKNSSSFTCVKPVSSMRGHTAFLTFAIMPRKMILSAPLIYDDEIKQNDEDHHDIYTNNKKQKIRD